MRITMGRNDTVQVEAPGRGKIEILIMDDGNILASIVVEDCYSIQVTNPHGRSDITVEK